MRLRHDGDISPPTAARVTWSRPAPTAGQYLVGLALDDNVPVSTRVLLESLALFDVSPAPADSPLAGGVNVALQGDFNELTRFEPLADRLAGESRILFSTAGVRYISSAGVHAWCELVAGLAGKHYAFRHCSLAFVAQAAMVPMVLGTGKVLSLEAPYRCETCDREEVRLLETRAVFRDGDRIVPPRLTCYRCGGELLFDDLPLRYFAFLISGPSAE